MNRQAISPTQQHNLPRFVYIGDCLLEKSLGVGGMGSVYKASKGDQTVAVKIINDDLLDDVKSRERFAREAAILGSLEHPGIVRVLSFDDDTDPHMVLGYEEGVTLDRLMGRITLPESVAIFMDLCDALSEMHSKGIVHRDVKPTNVIVRPDGRPVLLDFGIAKLFDEDTALTKFTVTSSHVLPFTDGVVGTPSYAPPEFFDARPRHDPRGDIYSLGTTMYRFLCGRLPFELENPANILLAKLSRPAPSPPPELGLPRRLEKIIMRTLERSMWRRFQSAMEMKDALKVCLDAPTLAERITDFLGFDD